MKRLETQLTSPNRALGIMIRCCLESNCYSNWTVSDIGRLFNPPALLGQYRIFYAEEQLVGFATWALLDETRHNEMTNSHADPTWPDWQSGTIPWVIDLVAIGNRASQIVYELRHDVFKNYNGYVYGIRRDRDGRFLKIGRWPTQPLITERNSNGRQ